MARNRRTLAIIIICLPILATVITAFRIRDLPKSHDSSKLDTKKPQQCENCDVKFGQKVHSVKIESDKYKYDDVKQKQQLNEKVSESKSTHKYAVNSDEDEDDHDDLQFSKVQTGFGKEYSKPSKLVKSELNAKLKISNAKVGFGIKNKEDNEDNDDVDFYDNDNEGDDDRDDDKSKKDSGQKIIKIKKEMPEKNKLEKKISQTKIATRKEHVHSDEDKNDSGLHDDEDKIKNDSKLKISETKSLLAEKPKQDAKQLKVVEFKIQNTENAKKHNNDNEKDEVRDEVEDDDNDDDDDDEDDEYEGLDYVDELFKILDMRPSSKSKNTVDKNHDIKKNVKIKRQTPKDDKKTDNKNSNREKDDNDDEDNNEDKKFFGVSDDNKSKVIPIKKMQSSTESHVKPDTNIEVLHKTGDKTKSPSKLEPKNVKKEVIKQDEKDSKSKISHDLKNTEASKKVEKPLDKTKKIDIQIKNTENDNTGDKDKEKTLKKPQDEKTIKDHGINDSKPKADSTKKSKEAEKEIMNSKLTEKENKSREKVDKKPNDEPKKDQTQHKDIFKAPETKKDIKYDFEKPNAYKDSHKTFDYTEFEKMQVVKSQNKEKKKEKTSSEKISDSREERYLKQVTDALNRRNLLKSEFEDFYAFFPTFAPNFSRIHNPECRRHGQILLRQLRGTKLWALNMLDATAKIPSGVLQGNGIQLGDFDQCLGSRARVQLDTGSVVKVQGKYCLARIDVKAENTELEAPVYLAQAKSLIRSRIDDPGHFVPRFSTLSWGVCVPSACDREDVEVIIKDAVKHYQHKSGVLVKVKVDEDDCHMDEGNDWEEWLELPTILTLSFYGIIILLVFVATVQDFIARRQPEEGQEETDEQAECDQKDKEEDENKQEPKKQSDGFLSPFSLYRSVKKLIAAGDTDEISCIHGIRGIATLALLIAHKFMPVASMPYTNRLKITEMASSPLWSWCRAGWVFTDCFLLLSGTLTSHRISGDSDTGAVRRLFSRYLRLTPALLAIVLFYAYIWDKISSGPMWGTFVTKNAEVCQQGWWWNLLYAQNYFGLEDMCAPQTHQLALDMQLTIAGGIIIWALQSEIPFAKLILPGLHLLSGYLRYTTVRDHRLTLLAYHGVSVSQLYRTARLSYTSTLHRCSPYLIGLSLGLALKKPSKHGKFLLSLGWLTSITLGALVVWSGINSGSTQYRYSATFAAQYATIAPFASAMAIAWVIYAVHIGTCDFLSRVLCWRPLVFISRLSYALYLCQFIIFITNIGTVRNSREFTVISLIDVQEISAILLASTILTVTFVIPMQSLHKIFKFEWKSNTEKSTEKEIEESEPKTIEEKVEEKKEVTPPTRSRHNLVAHRELLEEIPEAEVEYETHRENNEGLEEIMEEEEGAMDEEEDDMNDLEIIEEEDAGEEEALQEREGERSYSRADDQDMDEWEWTTNGSGRSGAQYYRYAR